MSASGPSGPLVCLYAEISPICRLDIMYVLLEQHLHVTNIKKLVLDIIICMQQTTSAGDMIYYSNAFLFS